MYRSIAILFRPHRSFDMKRVVKPADGKALAAVGDPDKFQKGSEPLRTKAKYRRCEEKIVLDSDSPTKQM